MEKYALFVLQSKIYNFIEQQKEKKSYMPCEFFY